MTKTDILKYGVIGVLAFATEEVLRCCFRIHKVKKDRERFMEERRQQEIEQMEQWQKEDLEFLDKLFDMAFKSKSQESV